MGCTATNTLSNQSNTITTLSRIYERKQLIGKGTYGSVYRCINRLNQQEFALKVVTITAKNRQQAQQQVNNLKRQIGVLKKLNHPNIVKYHSFDIGEEEKHVEIVLEYAEQGSLKEVINKNGPLTEVQAVPMVQQILEGLQYLHSKKIAHRDLKCANILVMGDGTLKITDFGTAKQLHISTNENIAQASASLKGTPFYMAPQVLKRSGHTVSADVWSLGCLVIQMLTGKAPWTSLTTDFQEIISYIVSGIHPPFPNSLSAECQCFLQSCTDPIPIQRLTAEQLLKHRWIDRKMHTDRVPQTASKRKESAPEGKYFSLEELEVVQVIPKISQPNLLDLKKHEIDAYISEQSQQRVSSKGRASAKRKKLKGSKDIKYPHLNMSELESQIEILPHRPPISKVKTAPQSKTPEIVVANLHNWEQIEERRGDQGANSVEATTRIITEHSGSNEAIINTAIARQERNRYLESEQKLKQQRRAQKEKWERQLKEGGNYLRKEINQNYLV